MCLNVDTQDDDSASHFGFIRFPRIITIFNISKSVQTPCCGLTTENTLNNVNM